jgi:thiol:disulfide interchange protein
MLRWLPAALVVVAVGCGTSPGGKKPPSPAAAEAARPISWGADYEQAVKQARAVGRPLMVDVSTSWCSACKRLDADVFSRADVAEVSKAFVCVRVDGDKRADLVRKFRVSGYPTVVFLDQDGRELGRARGAVPYQVMLEEMKRVTAAVGPGSLEASGAERRAQGKAAKAG